MDNKNISVKEIVNDPTIKRLMLNAMQFYEENEFEKDNISFSAIQCAVAAGYRFALEDLLEGNIPLDQKKRNQS